MKRQREAKFSEVVKAIRKTHLLTQGALAARLGVSLVTISLWENERAAPRASSIRKLREAFPDDSAQGTEV